MESKGFSRPDERSEISNPRKKKGQSKAATAQTSTSQSVSEIKEQSRNENIEEIEDLFKDLCSLSSASAATSKHVPGRDAKIFPKTLKDHFTDDVFERILNNDTLRKISALSTADIKHCCRSTFESLAVSSAGELCRETLQSRKSWKKARELRISGTRVYGIYTYTKNRSPDWAQKSEKFFWPTEFTNQYVRHGIEHEKLARETYEKQVNVKVVECGFIVHPDHRWVGYSPDGLILGKSGPEKLIEIKCVFVGKSAPITECLSSCKFLDKDGGLRKKHTYYGQIQLGMLLCNVKTCDFIVFASFDESTHVVSVPFDENFAIDMFVVVQNAYAKEMLHHVCLHKNKEPEK